MKKNVSLIFLVAVIVFALLADRWLVVQDQIVMSDFCHALGGGDIRTKYAIELYQQGLCGKLFFAGGKEDQLQSHSSVQKAVALAAGVPDDAIVIDEFDVFSTVDEVDRLELFLCNQKADARKKPTVSIVTDIYHSRRTSMVADWYLRSCDYRLLGVPYERSGGRRHWLLQTDSISFVLREYVKLVAYYFAYRFPYKPLNNWLLGFERIND